VLHSWTRKRTGEQRVAIAPGLFRCLTKTFLLRKSWGGRGTRQSFTGGAACFMHKDGAVVHDRKKKTLVPFVLDNVEKGATLYTDEFSKRSYSEQFVRHVINHAVEYVNGNVHTYGMETFWSLLKRGLKGTYVSVEPFHFFRYVDEQVWRYNHPAKPRGKMGRPPRLLQRTTDHHPISVKQLAMNLPSTAFREITWREGTDRKLRSRFATVRVRPAHRDHWKAEPLCIAAYGAGGERNHFSPLPVPVITPKNGC
jgi:hypothetical protein